MNTNQQAFLELVKAGLFPGHTDSTDITDGVSWVGVDWGEVYRLAREQGVLGLVVVGVERVKNLHANLHVNIPQVLLLQMIGEVQVIEQRNKAMNRLIAETVEKMREVGIYTMLVKGQGVAQCYERPLWRLSGDVDFLMSPENYKKAKAFLLTLSSGSKNEERYSQHLGMSIGEWYVEIHGSLRTGLSARVDKVVDKVVQRALLMKNGEFAEGVRVWKNATTDVHLPAPTEDVFLVFTHFIKHFYKEGMSLRQLCDWCRLMWIYKDSINVGSLESWIRKAGFMEEWSAFFTLVNRYLGMSEVSGFRLQVLNSSKWEKKAERLVEFILGGYSGNKVKNTWQIAKIFPWKTLRYSPSIFLNVNWIKVKERILQRYP